MRRALGRGSAVAAVALALSAGAPPARAQAPCPVLSVELDLRPAAGPARGGYHLIAALRDALGSRLVTVELDLQRGEETRSERSVPGGGTFAVEVAVDGGGRSASYSTELRGEDGVRLAQRATLVLQD